MKIVTYDVIFGFLSFTSTDFRALFDAHPG
jgi:hypothetical protein